MSIGTKLKAIRARLRRIRADKSGVALIEFAYVLPIMLVLGVGGLELSNLAVMNLRISQAAMHIGDNASRIGDRDILSAQKIYEGDINDLFLGVDIQAGARTDLLEHGRVIISSLEQNSDGGQWIHWQRCMGKKNSVSAHGPEGTGETGTDFEGMGLSGKELQASPGQAVIFVEIFYDYQPLMGNEYAKQFVDSTEIKTTAAFNVRGARDLTQIYQRSNPAEVRDCTKFAAI